MRELASGLNVGCRHGGCWRAVVMGLEKTNTGVINGDRCLDSGRRGKNGRRGRERGIKKGTNAG